MTDDLQTWRDVSRPQSERDRAFRRLLASFERDLRLIAGKGPDRLARRAAAIYGHDGAGGFMYACQKAPLKGFRGYAIDAMSKAAKRADWNAPPDGERATQANRKHLRNDMLPLDNVPLDTPAIDGPNPEQELLDQPDLGNPTELDLLIGRLDVAFLILDEAGQLTAREFQAFNAWLEASGRRAAVGEALGCSEKHGGRILDGVLAKLATAIGRPIDPRALSARPRKPTATAD